MAFRLNSLVDIKRFLSRITNENYAGDMDPERYRSLVSGLRFMREILEIQIIEQDLKERLDNLLEAYEAIQRDLEGR